MKMHCFNFWFEGFKWWTRKSNSGECEIHLDWLRRWNARKWTLWAKGSAWLQSKCGWNDCKIRSKSNKTRQKRGTGSTCVANLLLSRWKANIGRFMENSNYSKANLHCVPIKLYTRRAVAGTVWRPNGEYSGSSFVFPGSGHVYPLDDIRGGQFQTLLQLDNCMMLRCCAPVLLQSAYFN